MFSHHAFTSCFVLPSARDLISLFPQGLNSLKRRLGRESSDVGGTQSPASCLRIGLNNELFKDGRT